MALNSMVEHLLWGQIFRLRQCIFFKLVLLFTHLFKSAWRESSTGNPCSWVSLLQGILAPKFDSCRESLLQSLTSAGNPYLGVSLLQGISALRLTPSYKLLTPANAEYFCENEDFFTSKCFPTKDLARNKKFFRWKISLFQNLQHIWTFIISCFLLEVAWDLCVEHNFAIWSNCLLCVESIHSLKWI